MTPDDAAGLSDTPGGPPAEPVLADVFIGADLDGHPGRATETEPPLSPDR